MRNQNTQAESISAIATTIDATAARSYMELVISCDDAFKKGGVEPSAALAAAYREAAIKRPDLHEQWKVEGAESLARRREERRRAAHPRG